MEIRSWETEVRSQKMLDSMEAGKWPPGDLEPRTGIVEDEPDPGTRRTSRPCGPERTNWTQEREGPVAPAGRNGPTGPGNAKDRSRLQAGTEQLDQGTRRPSIHINTLRVDLSSNVAPTPRATGDLTTNGFHLLVLLHVFILPQN